MSFKDISYLELWWPFFSAERNHLCNFGRGHHEQHSCEIILKSNQWFSKRFCLKIFLIYKALAALWSAEWNHLCNFGRGHHEHFCKISLNLDQWFWRKCRLKYFSSRVLAASLIAEGNHLCNFGRGHYEVHFSVIILFWTSGSGDVNFKISYLELW